MKTDTPETRLLDRACALTPGLTLTITYRNERERDRARHRLYNAKRAFVKWSRDTYTPWEPGYGSTPWNDVSITRLNSQPLNLVLVKRADVGQVRNEED